MWDLGADGKRQLLEHQQTQEQQIAELLLLVKGGSLAQSELISRLEQLQTGVTSNGDQLSKVVQPIFYNERTPSSKAQKVFDIPELLEAILLQCDTRTLFRAQQVNRTFFHAIESSTALKRQMFLEPTVDRKELGTPFTPVPGWSPWTRCRTSEFVGICCELSENMWEDSIIDGTDIGVALNGEYTKKKVVVGARCRRMLICDPPIQKLDITTSCCCAVSQVSQDKEQGGITVGPIFDAIDLIRAEHKFCLRTGQWDHDDDGCVRPQFDIRGRMTVPANHSYVVARSRELKEAKAAQEEAIGEGFKKLQQMESYLIAKQAAHADGLPMPTLQEFLEQNSTAAAEHCN